MSIFLNLVNAEDIVSGQEQFNKIASADFISNNLIASTKFSPDLSKLG